MLNLISKDAKFYSDQGVIENNIIKAIITKEQNKDLIVKELYDEGAFKVYTHLLRNDVRLTKKYKEFNPDQIKEIDEEKIKVLLVEFLEEQYPGAETKFLTQMADYFWKTVEI